MHVKPGQVFRPIGVLNTFTELRHSKVKYEFVFYKVSSPPSPSSLLKLPTEKTMTATATATSLNKMFNEQNNGCARAL